MLFFFFFFNRRVHSIQCCITKSSPSPHNLYLPLSTNISIRDGHHGDNDLSDEGCNYSLPDRKTCGDQGSTELPIRKTHLINGPEGNVGPSCPCSTMGWKGSNVFVDPYIGYAASVGWESAVVDDGLKRHDDGVNGTEQNRTGPVLDRIGCVLWSVITHLCRDSILALPALPCPALLYYMYFTPPMYLFLSLTHSLAPLFLSLSILFHISS